jgi:hypothetical protein
MTNTKAVAIQALRDIVNDAPRGSEVHRRCKSALVALETTHPTKSVDKAAPNSVQ